MTLNSDSRQLKTHPNTVAVPMRGMQRPAEAEYDPYYHRYISLAPDGELLDVMAGQLTTFVSFVETIPEEKADYAYAPGKWTVKGVLGHLIDTERVFAHRALCVARHDPNPLPGWDQELWFPHGAFHDRELNSLLHEWAEVRRAFMAMLRGLPEAAVGASGTVNGFAMTARALVYLPIGHLEYHVGLLKTDYGLG